ncbi:MAG: DUF4159 domain-containing protein [Candidatus Latescibacterota bacterium]
MSSKRRRRPVRPVWGALLASLCLHLLAVFLAEEVWQEKVAPDTFRVRLAQPRLLRPNRMSVAGEARQLPRLEMEYLSAEGGPRDIPYDQLEMPQPAPLRLTPPGPPVALREFAAGAKEPEPVLPREEMVRPSTLGLADSAGVLSLDLLRIIDRARADRERSLVMIDPASKRDLLGYVNFTRLNVYGAGSRGAGLDALARYLRDYTRLLTRVRDQEYDYLLSEHLLKDPILFLCEGQGLPAYRDEVLTYFSPEEKALLGRYLAAGGFLYVEGSQRFLSEMAGHLQGILRDDGRLFPVPRDHMLYHSYYDFGDGFPGEDQRPRYAATDLDWGWDLPVEDPRAGSTQEVTPTPFAPQFTVTTQERPRRLGIWGVERRGQTVGILSDLGFHRGWPASYDTGATGAEASLMAATNVVVYALTRPGGLTVKEEPPRWVHRRPTTPLALAGPEEGNVPLPPSDELLADLDASLAVVQAPRGTPVGARGLQVTLDGRYTLELVQPHLSGVLLHNLPAGEHWLELTYGGKTKQLRVRLEGGKVQTVTFGLNRFAFLTQLHVGAQQEQIDLAQWLQEFTDLAVEQVHLGEDRALLEGSGGS